MTMSTLGSIIFHRNNKYVHFFVPKPVSPRQSQLENTWNDFNLFGPFVQTAFDLHIKIVNLCTCCF